MEYQRGNILLVIFMVGLFICIMGFAGYFLLEQYKIPEIKTPAPNQTVDPTANWNMLKNDELGFELKYPNNFFDAGHDPKILTGSCDYNTALDDCSQTTKIISQNSPDAKNIQPNWENSYGEKLSINNAPYLLCQTSDAATGHIYHHYYYMTIKNQKCLVANLETSTTNCDFYLPLEPGNTEQEKNYNECKDKNENQPKILEQIASTFKFNGTK